MREIAETAQKLDELIRSLSPSGKVPTYWNGVPADWPTDIPWGDTLIANALFATSALSRILDDPEEEQAWLWCEFCDDPECYDTECRGRVRRFY